MTDLQVKYQSLQLEKEKLAEEKRLHDAQISKYQADVALSQHQASNYDAQTTKYLKDAGLTAKDIEWYDKKSTAEIANKWMTGIGSVLSGIGKLASGGASVMKLFK